MSGDPYIKENEELEAENTRLRMLLRRWVDMKLFSECSMLVLETRNALAKEGK